MAFDPYAADAQTGAQLSGFDPYAPDPNAPGPLSQGFTGAVEGVKSSLYGVGAAIAGGFGAKGLEQAALAKAKEHEVLAGENARKIEDVKDFSGGVDYAKWALGTVLPSSLAFLGAAAVGRGTGALLARKATLEATKDFAKTVGAGVGGLGASTALETGQIYPNAVETGVDHPVARSLVGGVGAGALDVVGDLIPAARLGLLGKAAATTGLTGRGVSGALRTLGKDVPLSMAGEAITEPAQSYIERLAAGQSTTDADAMSDYINSAVVGGLGGTLTAPVSAVRGYIGNQEQNQQPTGDASREAIQNVQQVPGAAVPAIQPQLVPGVPQSAFAGPQAQALAAFANSKVEGELPGALKNAATPGQAPTATVPLRPAGGETSPGLQQSKAGGVDLSALSSEITQSGFGDQAEALTLRGQLQQYVKSLNVETKSKEKTRPKQEIVKDINRATKLIGDIDAALPHFAPADAPDVEKAAPRAALTQERADLEAKATQLDAWLKQSPTARDPSLTNEKDAKAELKTVRARAKDIDRVLPLLRAPAESAGPAVDADGKPLPDVTGAATVTAPAGPDYEPKAPLTTAQTPQDERVVTARAFLQKQRDALAQDVPKQDGVGKPKTAKELKAALAEHGKRLAWYDKAIARLDSKTPISDAQAGVVAHFMNMTADEIKSMSPESQRKLFEVYFQQAQDQAKREAGGPYASSDNSGVDGPTSPAATPNVPSDRDTNRGVQEDIDARLAPTPQDIADINAKAAKTGTKQAQAAAKQKTGQIERLDRLRKEHDALLDDPAYRLMKRRAETKGIPRSDAERTSWMKAQKARIDLETQIYDLEDAIYAKEAKSELGSKAASGSSERPFRGSGEDHAAMFEERARAMHKAAEKEAIDRLEEEWRIRREMREQAQAANAPGSDKTSSSGQSKYAGKTGSKTHAPLKDGAFTVDEDGYVLDKKGVPIQFGHQREAGFWILRVGNKQSQHQIFQIANHPGGKGFTVQQTGVTEQQSAGDVVPAGPLESTSTPRTPNNGGIRETRRAPPVEPVAVEPAVAAASPVEAPAPIAPEGEPEPVSPEPILVDGKPLTDPSFTKEKLEGISKARNRKQAVRNAALAEIERRRDIIAKARADAKAEKNSSVKTRVRNDPFIKWLVQRGGIGADYAKGLTGEGAFKSNHVVNRLFRKPVRNSSGVISQGHGLDEIATAAIDAGWMSPAEADDVDGGVARISEIISAALRGERPVHLSSEDAVFEAIHGAAMRGVDPDALADSGFEALGADLQERVAYLAARFEALFGEDEREALQETVFNEADGEPDDIVQEILLREFDKKFQDYSHALDAASATENAGGVVAGGPGAGAEGSLQTDRSETQERPVGSIFSDEDRAQIDQWRARAQAEYDEGNLAEGALAEQYADKLIERGKSRGRIKAQFDQHGYVELKNPARNSWAVVLENASKPGEFRASWYDAYGISGHIEAKTVDEIIHEVVAYNYTQFDPDSLDRLQQTNNFWVGMKAALDNQTEFHRAGQHPGEEPPAPPAAAEPAPVEPVPHAPAPAAEAVPEAARPDLDLTGQTNAEILAAEKAEQEEYARLAREAAIANITPNVTVDQVDLFNTQGGLFGAASDARGNAEVATATVGDEGVRVAVADAAEQADVMASSSAAVADAPNVADEITARVESTLTADDKAVAATALGEPEWNGNASQKFKNGFAEWLQQGARDLTSALGSLYSKVMQSIRNGLLSVAVAFNFNVATPLTPVQVQTTAQTLTITKEKPRADFKGNAASADAKIMADWMVRNNAADGKPFIIADKPNGLLYAFNGSGKLLAKSPGLFGAAQGDVLSQAQANKPIGQTTAADKITPAGIFKSSGYKSADYGNAVKFAGYENTNLLIHRVYLGTPSEQRMARLTSPTGTDNRISYGCINALPEFVDQVLVPHFMGDSQVVVLPETQSASTFFGVDDSEFETESYQVGGSNAGANVAWGTDSYGLTRQERAKRSGSRRLKEKDELSVIRPEDDPGAGWPEGMNYAVHGSLTGTLEFFKSQKEAVAWMKEEQELRNRLDPLFSKDAVLRAYDERGARFAAIGQEVAAKLGRMLGASPDLQVGMFEQRTPGGPVGVFSPSATKDVIQIAYNAAMPLSVAAHEGFHRIEARHLNAQDRSVIRRELKKGSSTYNEILGIARRYDAANGTSLADEISGNPKEASAYAYQFWDSGELQPKTALGKVFQKIKNFITQVRNFIDGYGFKSMSDIFEAVDRGAYAKSDASIFLQNSREAYSGLESESQDLWNGMQRQAGSVAPVWYSGMARAIGNLKQNSATPAQWKGTIKALKDVKPAEIAETGIEDWLDMQGDKVSRGDIMAFLDQNGVKVSETTLGAGSTPDSGGLPPADYDNTRFAKWQLPGGENYKELLLTLPEKEALTTIHPDDVEITEPRNKDIWVARHGSQEMNVKRVLAPTAFDAQVVAATAFNRRKQDSSKVDFRAGHFDQPNVLAHVRFNERKDADGKTVLFLEEIQSDWAQKGRKEGFVENNKPNIKVEESHFKGFWTATIITNGVSEPVGSQFSSRDDAEKAATSLAKERAINRGSVPSAPFVTKTEAWVALAMKRMIRYAAENGFDRVAWTTGEQNAARYDLSKQVERIEVSRPAGGGFALYLYKNKTDTVPLKQTRVETENEVEALVGKDLAAKITKQPAGTKRDYTGLDLKVGGEGMKAFYDKIVPNVANDILKKMGGGRVGEVKIDLPFTMNAKTGADVDGGVFTQPGFDITDALAHKVLGEGLPLFSRDALAKGPEAMKAAALEKQSLQDMARRVQAGEIPHTQFMAYLAQHVETAQAPDTTFAKLFGALGTAFKGGIARAYLSTFSTGNNIAKHSKGYKNVFDAISAYQQSKNKLIADNLDLGLSKWKPWEADAKDAETAGKFLMDRTSSNWKLDSPEYMLAHSKLTAKQKDMVAQANETIPKMLWAEFEAEKAGYRAALPDEEYARWEANRTAQIEGLIEFGYVPERRYGKFGVRVSVPITGSDGIVRHEQLRYNLFETQAQQELFYHDMVGTEQTPGIMAGMGLVIEKSTKLQPEFDASLSFKQFLDMAGRHGVEITQVEREKLAKAMITADSTRRNRIFQRKNIPGYSEDATRVLAEFVTNISNKVSYAQYGEAIQDALNGKRVTVGWENGKPTMQIDQNARVWSEDGENAGYYSKEAQKMVQAVIGPQDDSSLVRNMKMIATLHFLGGSAALVPVQLTSIPINVIPYLTKSTSYTQASATAINALKKTIANGKTLFHLDKLSDKSNKVEWVDNIPGLRDAMIRAGEDGTTMDTELYQLMGMTRGGLMSKSRNTQRAVEAWMKPFQWSEKVNRVSTFAAAYQVGMQNKLGGDALYKFAQQAVFDTQIRYDMANRPAIMRNPIFSLLFTFKTYPIAMTELLVNMMKEDKKAGVAMLGSLFLLAGVNGMPFRENIMDIIDTISQRFFGQPFNSQRWMRNHMKNASEAVLGGDYSGWFFNGIVNSLTDLNLQSRVGLHNIIPGTRLAAADVDWTQEASQMLGPIGAQVINGFKGVGSLAKGDFAAALRQAGPTAAQNMVKAMEQYQHGYALDGKGQKLADVSGWNIMWQALGFSNATLSNAYELDRIDKETMAYYALAKNDFIKDITDGVRDNDREKVANTMALITSWNEANPDMQMSVDAASLRRHIQQAGMPLNQRTLERLPTRLRGSSFSLQELNAE